MPGWSDPGPARSRILMASVGLWIVSSLLIVAVVALHSPAPRSPEPPSAPPAAPPTSMPEPPPRRDPLRPRTPKKPQVHSVKLRNVGSDTMIELAQIWAEECREGEVEVAGGGSGVGLAALIAGKADIANTSRPPTESELDEAMRKTGKELEVRAVGYDALAIYVHRDNPLEDISLEQLKDIYGEGGKISSWSQLGVKVPGCTSRKIVVLGRQSNCGSYEFFREHVLGKQGRYKLGTIDQSGSKDVVALVGKTPCAIGYSGMSYQTDAVKFLKVRGKEGEAVGPSLPAVYAKTYPISRPLFMCTLGEGTPEVRRFLDWARSDAGQAILERSGYVPLSAEERTPGQGE